MEWRTASGHQRQPGDCRRKPMDLVTHRARPTQVDSGDQHRPHGKEATGSSVSPRATTGKPGRSGQRNSARPEQRAQSILMVAALLRNQLSDPVSRKMLDTAESSARRGSDMVKQILSFARGVAGEKGVLQVKHLVSDMVRLAKDTFRS